MLLVDDDVEPVLAQRAGGREPQYARTDNGGARLC
jgi:hypothetical protein